MKKCTVCDTEKAESEFYVSHKRGTSYVIPRCKACTRAWVRAYAKRNPDKIRTDKARYHAKIKADPERLESFRTQHRERARARYKADPEGEQAKLQAWRAANPEKVAAWRANNAVNKRWNVVKHRYGLTRESWTAIYEGQRGLCAICEIPMPPRPMKQAEIQPGTSLAHIDHDHVTGKVRGLLCFSCNRGIGSLGDDPARLRRALDYLTR